MKSELFNRSRKQKMSISVDEDKIRKIEEHVKNGIFRNKSHALEKGIEMILDSLEAENEQ